MKLTPRHQSTCRLLSAFFLTTGLATNSSAYSPLAAPQPLSMGVLPANLVDLLSTPFEDLLPKFQKLVGGTTTIDEAVALMGKPSSVDYDEFFGISIQVLTWTNLRGQTFRARFVHGRLASKSFAV